MRKKGEHAFGSRRVERGCPPPQSLRSALRLLFLPPLSSPVFSATRYREFSLSLWLFRRTLSPRRSSSPQVPAVQPRLPRPDPHAICSVTRPGGLATRQLVSHVLPHPPSIFHAHANTRVCSHSVYVFDRLRNIMIELRAPSREGSVVCVTWHAYPRAGDSISTRHSSPHLHTGRKLS